MQFLRRALDHLLGRSPQQHTDWEALFAAVRDSDQPPHAQTDLHELEEALAVTPHAVAPVLAWLEESYGAGAAEASAGRIATQNGSSAGTLTELAHFRYGREQYALGDKLLERAKQQDPCLRRIFEEEAWNQRQRSNVHREIRAVERCIELTTNPAELRAWEFWLGQALLRRQDPQAAWRYLSRYLELPAGDDRVFSAASCARQLDLGEHASAALRHAAPGPVGSIDRKRAAIVFLTHYPSPQDAEWALSLGTEPLGASSPTRELELGAQAALRIGDSSLALSRIALASARSDRGLWVAGFHGMLLEILGLPQEAARVYRAHPLATPLERFRAATLLRETSSTHEAVRWLLGSTEQSERPWSSLAGGEVDPELVRLLESGTSTAANGGDDAPTNPGYSRRELHHILRSASSTALRAQAAWSLARLDAAAQNWEGAWNHIVAAQDLRLPALPFTELDQIGAQVTPEVRYAEFSETEPVSSGTVLYESGLGAHTLGDPLAMCLALIDTPDSASVTHVWSIRGDATPHPQLLGRPNVHFVRKGSPGYFRTLATAGLLITNATQPTEFIKRQDQRSAIIWQGTPWEAHGRDRREAQTRHGNVTRNFLHADTVLCADQTTLASLPAAMDVDELAPSAFVLADPPRLALTANLSRSRRETLATELGVGSTDQVILYAPHFANLELHSQTEMALIAAGALAVKGTLVVIAGATRLERELSLRPLPDHVVIRHATHDLNELLGLADAVVSEGAPVLSDADALGITAISLTSHPQTPGVHAPTLSAARKALERLGQPTHRLPVADEPRFSQAASRALELVSSKRASEDTTPHPIPSSHPSRTLLLSTDGFPENGITQSLRSLLTHLDGTGCSAYLRPWPSALTQVTPEIREELFARARLIIGVGKPAGTRMEQEALRFFSSNHYIDSPLIREFLVAERRREGRRRFGDASFDGAIEFTGYLSTSIAMSAYGAPVRGRRGVVFHNEMWEEIRFKYPQLRAGMQVLDGFDFIGSVSDGVRLANAEAMSQQFGVPQELHVTIENTLDTARIRHLAQSPLATSEDAWYAQPGLHACVVARMSPEKNHEELLRVLADCRDTLPDRLCLSLLGDGPLRADLERLCTELGLNDLVRFFGHVAAPQAHLRTSNALLLPSLREGQPLVILEALTVGTPVVATDTPGSRSALKDGIFGVLVPPTADGLADALRRIAAGQLVSAEAFDPAAFTLQSLTQLWSALDFPAQLRENYARNR